MAQYHIGPVGPFTHPWINKADTKFNADGLYTVDQSVTGKPAESLAAKIEGAAQAALNDHTADMKPSEAKKWSLYVPFERVEDDESGEPTGEVIFNFKQNAKIKLRDGSTKDVKIELRDAKDKVIDAQVFSGSEGRVLFSMRPIVMTSSKQVGVRLDFAKVQVTKLQQGGGASRGFGEYEGGYVAEGKDQSFGEAGDVPDEEGEY